MMTVKLLTQLREIVSKALSSQTNIGKSFRTFFIETMELYLTNKGHINFTTMAKLGRSCESRFRQNFRKAFDWLIHQRCQGLCSAGKHQSFRRLDKNPAAQCCNGGSIYCNVR